MDVPQDLIDKLGAAETALDNAKGKDAALGQAQAALQAAESAEDDARKGALAAHQEANALAHFGLE